MSTLVELAKRLREAANRPGRGNPDYICVISVADAIAAADALEALTPPAEIVRYDFAPVISADDGEPVVVREQLPNGEYVRYEDHAAALARVKTSGQVLISIGADAAIEAADIAEGWKERAEKAEAALAAALASLAEKERRIGELEGALPDLSSVIVWLSSGCDPKWAATELRGYKKRIDRARPPLSTTGRASE